MRTFQSTNPATGEKLPGEFPIATPSDVNAAAEKAAKAFEAFRSWDGKRRADFLRAIATKIEAAAPELAARANLETALPLPRLSGEIARTCGQLRAYGAIAEEGSWIDARIDHGDPKRQPLPKPDLCSMFRPVGPVVVFGASNFPFAYSTAGGDTASALAAGCPVIVKAHPAHPGTSDLVAKCIQAAIKETGAPDGVFAQLFDNGYEVGVALVKHPLVKAVGFTGSRRGGRALMDLAAARPEPIPVFAEMGSVNPVVILPDAATSRGEEIATGLHGSFTLGVGQFCTNSGIVFAPANASAFIAKLKSLTEATQPGVMLTRGIADAFAKGTAHLAQLNAVTVIAHGPEGASGTGQTQLLTTTATEFAKNAALAEECFGPSTLVVQYATTAELIAALRTLDGQLTATIHATQNDGGVAGVQTILEEKGGRLVFNGFPTGVEVCDSQVHGGPYPATSAANTTSVGSRALSRFVRLVAFQNAPQSALPMELRDGNPLKILRRVNGIAGRD